MKVYIALDQSVEDWYYVDTGILGVFSSKEKCLEMCKGLNLISIAVLEIDKVDPHYFSRWDLESSPTPEQIEE
jgi:hypothetical protein